MPELAGRTEPVIFREALKVNGVNPAEDLYDNSPPSRPEPTPTTSTSCAPGRALPGAAEALRRSRAG